MANSENFTDELDAYSNIGSIATLSTRRVYNDTYASAMVAVINIYYTPLLVIVGSLGNLLSAYVFMRSKLRHLSSSYYLTTLNICDTLLLLQIFVVWLRTAGISEFFDYPIICQLIVYMSNVCSSLSAWCVMAFTIERFIAVLYPLRRQAICTVSRARQILAGLTALAMMANFPLLIIATPNPSCSIKEMYASFAAGFNIFDTIISFMAPLTAIIILNVTITCVVCRVTSKRSSIIACGDKNRSNQVKVTKMLLIVSSAFVILNMPAYVIRIIAFATSEHEQYVVVQHVCNNIVFYTNFGINFILYCVSGQNFRRELRAILFPQRVAAEAKQLTLQNRAMTTTAAHNAPPGHTLQGLSESCGDSPFHLRYLWLPYIDDENAENFVAIATMETVD